MKCKNGNTIYKNVYYRYSKCYENLQKAKNYLVVTFPSHRLPIISVCIDRMKLISAIKC